jgi:SH3-like domain-containing protein
MCLKFVAPLMPPLVKKPPGGKGWVHEVKFDGYRSQMIIDDDGTRIYTRKGMKRPAAQVGKPRPTRTCEALARRRRPTARLAAGF